VYYSFKVEAAASSDTSITISHTSRRHTSEYRKPNTDRRLKLNPYNTAY
jgi:hypothetical protein